MIGRYAINHPGLHASRDLKGGGPVSLQATKGLCPAVDDDWRHLVWFAWPGRISWQSEPSAVFSRVCSCRARRVGIFDSVGQVLCPGRYPH